MEIGLNLLILRIQGLDTIRQVTLETENLKNKEMVTFQKVHLMN